MPAVAVLDFSVDDAVDSLDCVDECPFDAISDAPNATADATETQSPIATEVLAAQEPDSTITEALAGDPASQDTTKKTNEIFISESVSSSEPEKEKVSETPNTDAAQKSFSDKRYSEYRELLNKQANKIAAIDAKKFEVADQSALVRTLENDLKDEKKSLKEKTDELILAEKELAELEHAVVNFDFTASDLGSVQQVHATQHQAPSLAGASAAATAESGLTVVRPLEVLNPVATSGNPDSSSGRRRKPDPGLTADLWVLKSHSGKSGKVTDSMIEKLNGRDVRTVSQLEEFMRSGDFVPGRTKGLGETAIDKVSDALMSWRRANPVPGEDEFEDVVSESQGIASASAVPPEELPYLDDGDAPDGAAAEAYVAGCEAAASDQPVNTNPHEKGTQLWLAWNKGWQETNAQDTRETITK